MKKLLLAALCFLGMLVLNPSKTIASHLMGGNLSYVYQGLNPNTGLYQYAVTLKIYRLCNSGSSNLPTSMALGAYEEDAANPSGNKIRIATSTLQLYSQQFITPPNANDSCTFAPNVCVEEGIFTGTISVPANTTGYYFIADRCCRNSTIANITSPGTSGQAYYAYAPDPTIVNSSPTFAVAPVPFICAGDTVSVLNQAIDPDGDLLTYELVTPYQGISNNGNPNPNPPTSYTWPIPLINYAGTFSNALPFGTGSYSSIDSTTGLASYLSPSQGYYVVAVEIKEYRNGVLIGVSRLDLQIIVITCPVNPAPTLAAGSTSTTYTIQEGQTLCFNVGFTDPNGDSLYIAHTGDIFNSATTNPTATLSNVSGSGTATSQFCWSTSCNQGRTTPYQFSAIASDNGCPAKTTNVVYTINVLNTAKPTSITGPDTLCFNAATGIGYTVNATSGYTYNWTVTHGIQVSGTNTTTAGINFNTPGLATVSVVALNAFGCPSDTLTKIVYIKPQPTATAGSDISFCSGGSATIGGATTSGYNYSWSPSSGLSSSTVSNPTVTLTNSGSTSSTTNYIVTSTLNGCINSDTVVVTSNPYPIANAGNNVSICSGSSVPLGALTTAGYTYSWSPSSGLSNGSVSNPVITLTNTGNTPDTLHYIVQVSNGFTCVSYDTVQIIVRPIPTADAGLDITFCSGQNGNIGASSISGYTYSWTPSSGIANTTSSNTSISLTNSTTTNDTVNVILTTGWFGCTDKDTVAVIVRPVPASNAGNNLYLCSGSSGQIGTLNTSGYTYSWTPSTGLSNNSISNPVVSLSNTGNTTDTIQYIVTTSLAGCVSADTVRVVTGPVPVANAGLATTYCSGQSATLGAPSTLGYTYAWTPSTGLSSATISSPVTTATNTGTTPLTINYSVITTWFGCRDTDFVAITINPMPVSNAGTNLYLCSGSSGQIGTLNTSGYTYSWTPSTGLSNNSISNPVVSLSNTGNTTDTIQYIVTTSLAGCVSADTVRVVTGPVPVANAGLATTYCSGQSATLGAPSTLGYTYAWTPSTGLSSATISNPISAATNTGTTPITISYSIVATWFGCRDTDFVAITVNPLPVSNAGTNQLLCSGNTVQLGTSATAGYTYSWTPATNLSNSTVSNPTLTDTTTAAIPDTLQYTVTTTLNGCSTTADVTVFLSPIPTAVAGSDVTFCSGQSGSFGTNTTPNYNYTWSPSTGLSSSTTSSPTITLTNGTTNVASSNYILTTNLFGCIDKDTVTVFVKPLPVSEAGTATSLCNGDTIYIGAPSTSGYTYSWSPGNGLISTTISDPQLFVLNNGTTPTTLYYTVTTTLNGCTTSDSVSVTSNPLPNVTAVANPIAICIGNSATLTGSGAPNFSWALLASPGLSIGTSANFTVTPTNTTSYILTGTSTASCLNYDTIVVFVNPLPNVQISTLNTQMCYGDTITLSGTGASNFTWNELPSGTTIGSLNSVDVHPTTNTSYVLTGIDDNSCSNKDTIDITVNPAATINGITGTLSVCPGVTGVQYWVNNPNSASTYSWNITNGTIGSGQGTDTITVDWSSISGNGSVSVIEITDKGCNSDPIILPVTINVILTPIAPTGTQTLCANLAQSQAYSTINTPGSTYTWHAQGGTVTQGNGTNNVIVDWTVTGPQTVALWYEEASVTADTVCFGISDTLYVTINPAPQTSAIIGSSSICVSDTGSFIVTNTTGSNYSWTITGGNILNGNGSNGIQATWNGSPTAVISVQETNSYGCVGTMKTYNVTVNPLPNASAGINDTICTGNSTTLNASGGTIYTWTPGSTLDNIGIANPIANPTNTTTYTVLVTDVNGCKKSAAVTIVVNALPIISAGNNTAICIGSSTTLNGTGGSSYSWTPSTGLNNPSISNPTANPTSNTTYTVIGTDNNGCTNTSSVIVNVNPLPVADAGQPNIICNGGSVTLTATGGASYLWSPAGSLINETSATPIATPTTTTTYTVTVTDANGCTDDAQVEISVNAQPTADFIVDSLVTVIGCEGIEVSIVNNSSNALQYVWTLGDGTSTTDVNINHLYAFSGALNITLIAQNNQCADTLVKSFTPGLLNDFLSNIPNVFTPNNDGVNDCYNLGSKTNFDDCSSWQIFNRWGSEVFSSGPGKECWNGKKDNEGDILPTGTYFYILKIAGEQYKGTVMLVQ